MLAQGDLRELMRLYGRTPTQVGAAAGVSEARVRHIITCRKRARPETIEKIERAIIYAGCEPRPSAQPVEAAAV